MLNCWNATNKRANKRQESTELLFVCECSKIALRWVNNVFKMKSTMLFAQFYKLKAFSLIKFICFHVISPENWNQTIYKSLAKYYNSTLFDLKESTIMGKLHEYWREIISDVIREHIIIFKGILSHHSK